MTQAAKKVADAYGVKFVAGTLMEQITRCVTIRSVASIRSYFEFRSFACRLKAVIVVCVRKTNLEGPLRYIITHGMWELLYEMPLCRTAAVRSILLPETIGGT